MSISNKDQKKCFNDDDDKLIDLRSCIFYNNITHLILYTCYNGRAIFQH